MCSERLREKLYIAEDRRASFGCRGNYRGAPIDARADRNHIGATHAGVAKFTAFEYNLRQLMAERVCMRRIAAGVGNRHRRAAARRFRRTVAFPLLMPLAPAGGPFIALRWARIAT